MINKNLPIIIDTDGGADDAFAIMAAHALFPSQICLMVATYGNYTLDTVTENLSSVMELANITSPLIRTSDKAIDKVFNLPNIADPFYKIDPCFPKGKPAESCNDFEEYIYNLAKEHKKINYVTLGPLTNVARLLRRYPDIVQYIDSLIMMGGGIDLHNVTDYAEYNLFCDPWAAKEVYESSLQIYMSGLGVCQKSILTKEQIKATTENAGKLYDAVYNLFDIERRYSEGYGNPVGIIYDACATIYMAHPEIFKTEQTGIDVLLDDIHFGETVKTDKRNNVTLLKDVDRDAFADVLLNAVKSLG